MGLSLNGFLELLLIYTLTLKHQLIGGVCVWGGGGEEGGGGHHNLFLAKILPTADSGCIVMVWKWRVISQVDWLLFAVPV